MAANARTKGTGNTVRFTDSADMYGSGFIIEGDRIRGKMATCTIKARRQEGDTLHLLAHCATDIALSDNQFSLTIVDQNKVSRIFPGMPESPLPGSCVFL